MYHKNVNRGNNSYLFPDQCVDIIQQTIINFITKKMNFNENKVLNASQKKEISKTNRE